MEINVHIFNYNPSGFHQYQYIFSLNTDEILEIRQDLESHADEYRINPATRNLLDILTRMLEH
jgi:hypothetical protein